ncbi:hypothetical protein HMPREF9595_02231 [Cutibacterium acnes HL005PA2]|nr:hypothetical protein HMPREF9595_02231 [Cutibacterium acnes HL005PA2]
MLSYILETIPKEKAVGEHLPFGGISRNFLAGVVLLRMRVQCLRIDSS